MHRDYSTGGNDQGSANRGMGAHAGGLDRTLLVLVLVDEGIPDHEPVEVQHVLAFWLPVQIQMCPWGPMQMQILQKMPKSES